MVVCALGMLLLGMAPSSGTDNPGQLSAGGCPCSPASLCDPITAPLDGRREVFGFGSGNWRGFDWSVLTTVVPTALHPADIDPQLVCHAHAHGTRVVAFAPGGTEGSGGQTSALMPLSA